MSLIHLLRTDDPFPSHFTSAILVSEASQLSCKLQTLPRETACLWKKPYEPSSLGSFVPAPISAHWISEMACT